VQALQQELMRQRGPNMNFDFTMNNNQQTNGTNKSATSAPTLRNPFQPNTQANGNQQSSPSPSSGSITDSSIFRSGQSSLATSPENDQNKNGTPNIDVPFDLFSTNSAGPVFNTNSSNQPSPLFSSDIFSNSPASTTNNNSLFNQGQAQTSPILDTFASTLASLQKGQSPTSLAQSNAFNSNVSNFTPNSTSLYDLNDPLFSSWRDNSISSSGGDDTGFDIFDTMFSSMSPGAFNLVDMSGLTEFITDSDISMQQNLPPPQLQQSMQRGEVACPELWEKVKNHPNFDDIDIDQLCAEMRSKAKVCALSKSSSRTSTTGHSVS
jgi:Transcription factor PAP1